VQNGEGQARLWSSIIPRFSQMLNSKLAHPQESLSRRTPSRQFQDMRVEKPGSGEEETLGTEEVHDHQRGDVHFHRRGEEQQGDHQEDEDLDQIREGQQQALADGEA